MKKITVLLIGLMTILFCNQAEANYSQKFSWTLDGTLAGVGGYKLYIKNVDTGIIEMIECGYTNTYEVPNLQLGTNYSITATAWSTIDGKTEESDHTYSIMFSKAAPEPPPALLGDCMADNVLNSTDIQKGMQNVGKSITLDNQNCDCYPVGNPDGKIDSNDVATIKKYVYGLL